ncbi:Ribosomal RNA assembly protein KRR1 [Spironucleus salmonicida]|uniref:KRR-R motif-containing protein 1 n=1 Tax=Spironucleus salmonicida TaxID=348837 RepID=V6LJK1_9EUKA|nr:Ribosomal RNA assembly protein KRR1 [Spironucleus salmonicida]|eukprot:EST44558.1 Ribosomal RNA assembly protein KRR1 [Spironucleus salmonicida]
MSGDQQDELSDFDPTQIISKGKCPLYDQLESEVAVPKARIPYIVQNFPFMRKSLLTYGVELKMNLQDNSLSVQTNKNLLDPTTYLLAKQYIQLVSRGFAADEATLVFQPSVECEIIKLRPPTSKALKRRTRFAGPQGQTMKALGLLTNTRLALSGKTLAVIGSPQGIELMMGITRDCFEKNIHPVKWVKGLMIRRELQKVPDLENEDWSKFYPKEARRNHKKKKVNIHKKKNGIVDVGKFSERKVDKQMEMGDFSAFKSKKSAE